MEHRLNLSTVYSREPLYMVNDDKLSMYWCKCSYLKTMLNLDIIHWFIIKFCHCITHYDTSAVLLIRWIHHYSPLKIFSKNAIWRLSQAVLWSPGANVKLLVCKMRCLLPFGFQHITKWNICLTTVPLYPVRFFPQERIWWQVFATSVCNRYCYHANASCLVTWHSCENEGEYINYADMNGNM